MEPPVQNLAFDRKGTLLAVAGMALAVALAYGNTLRAPFVFDDLGAIVENPDIRGLWPLTDVLWPDGDGISGVSGRPLVNLSLALNYAAGGLDVTGYHLANLLIHFAAGLALFGVVRRTLAGATAASGMRRTAPAATAVAAAVAMLWLVHPLQTESVTCVVQRTESLMGLFFLLCFYGYIRGVQSTRPWPWFAVAVGAGLSGMATKEVMAVAPVLVLLHDRTFFAGGFREAWQQRGRFHGALAATWILLAAIVVAGGGRRGEAAGFGLGVSSWDYLLTQAGALVLYLRLSFWPSTLVLDYGTDVTRNLAEAAVPGLVILGLLGLTVGALWRRPAAGFAGAWFFAILAPSSSVVPLVAQTVAEHRMYLPLAAVIALPVVWLHSSRPRALLPVAGVLAVVLGIRTFHRNADYATVVGIWAVTVESRPGNFRALNNLGRELTAAGRPGDALEPLMQARRLQPALAEIRYNLGNALVRLRRVPEAEVEYREAVTLDSRNVVYRHNRAIALALLGRTSEAVAEFGEVLRLRPDYEPSRTALRQLGAAP